MDLFGTIAIWSGLLAGSAVITDLAGVYEFLDFDLLSDIDLSRKTLDWIAGLAAHF
jgi:hypothetical protein